MKEKLWAFCRKLISLGLNLSILYMETIAMPISWDYGHELGLGQRADVHFLHGGF